MDDVTSCIYNVPIFRDLPNDSVQRLQRVMVHRTLQSGETCARAGDLVEHLFVVHIGRLRLSRVAVSGREQVLRDLRPGDFYGEIGLFTDVVNEGDLTAAEDTEACVLDRSAVHQVLANHPEMTIPLVRALARRLFEAERTVGDLALYDVGRRLAAALLREAASASGMDALGADVLLQGEVAFEMTDSWARWAARLGTTPESLSRRLNELRSAGLVRNEGRHIVIPDPAALRDTLYGDERM